MGSHRKTIVDCAFYGEKKFPEGKTVVPSIFSMQSLCNGLDLFPTPYILSVSKITYPLGSLGNNKETQQAPEPSSSDYIIVTC